jgi:nitronate monooxygenase
MMAMTAFTDLVGCAVPIQQAGMGGIATTELAAAVADAGALGMVAMHGSPPNTVVNQLERLGALTSGSFGINFLMPFVDPAIVEVAASRCHLIEFFYGDPDSQLVDRVRQGGAVAAWQVGSRDEALAAVDAGCQLVIAQGTEAGGHVRGDLGLLPLLDAVLDAVDVPVVAAGGIATARGVAAVLAAGASGARIGTRFVACAEANAHPAYVEALLQAESADTVLTEAFGVGWPNAPHRVLRSCVETASALSTEFVAELVAGDATHKIPRFSTDPPSREVVGRIDAMALYAGQGVGAIRTVQTAAAIVRELMGTSTD